MTLCIQFFTISVGMRTNHINVTKSANRVAAPTANDLGALTMYNNPRF